MDGHLRVIHLGTHDETAWTHRGQHTGLTDLPLTPQGEGNARGLRTRFADLTFAQVFTSRLHRLRPRPRIQPKRRSCVRTAYAGLRSEDIRFKRSDWRIFRDGCPGGESPAQVKARGAIVCCSVCEMSKSDVLLFSSGHFMRLLAARWMAVQPSVPSMSFLLSTARLRAAGYGVHTSG